jgi:hypothetical protein
MEYDVGLMLLNDGALGFVLEVIHRTLEPEWNLV